MKKKDKHFKRMRKAKKGESVPPVDVSQESSSGTEGVRINKYLARAGVASRRKADGLIEQGLVRVNGQVVTSFGQRVQVQDRVEVNGKLISRVEKVYFLLNKPRDIITTTDDERGRRTVLDLLSIPDSEKEGLFPVGRLDRNTVGVLLLTNDGDLAHRLMHPRYEIDKLYVVRTKDPLSESQLQQLREGVQLEDGEAKADQVARTNPEDLNEVGIGIHEGRNRQIRRMFEALGHSVSTLERVQYAGLTAKGVRRGKWRRLERHEVQRLRRMVKLKG